MPSGLSPLFSKSTLLQLKTLGAGALSFTCTMDVFSSHARVANDAICVVRGPTVPV